MAKATRAQQQMMNAPLRQTLAENIKSVKGSLDRMAETIKYVHGKAITSEEARQVFEHVGDYLYLLRILSAVGEDQNSAVGEDQNDQNPGTDIVSILQADPVCEDENDECN